MLDMGWGYWTSCELENESGHGYTDALFTSGGVIRMCKQGKLFVVSGPSGVGKTTLTNSILANLGQLHNLNRVITYTTKAPRPGEVAGIDYHYISADEFRFKIAEQFFLEYSQVYGNYYGSPRSILTELKEGKSFIIVLDQPGAYSIKSFYPAAVLIWIMPPSLLELRSRLVIRQSDTIEEIERRLAIAEHEITTEQVNLRFDYHVTNQDFAKTKESLKQIISSEMQLPIDKFGL